MEEEPNIRRLRERNALLLPRSLPAASALAWRLAEDYDVQKGNRVAIAMRNYPNGRSAFCGSSIIGASQSRSMSWNRRHLRTDSAIPARSPSSTRLTVGASRFGCHRMELLPHSLRFARLDKLGAAKALQNLSGSPTDYEALPDRAPPDRDIEPDDDATILYSIRFDGRPKAPANPPEHRVQSRQHHVCGARAAIHAATPCLLLPTSRNDPAAPSAVLPCDGLSFRHGPRLANGTKIVLMHKGFRKSAAKLIEREHVATMSGVPSMAWQLLEIYRLRKAQSQQSRRAARTASPRRLPSSRKIAAASFPATSRARVMASPNIVGLPFEQRQDYRARPDSVGPQCPVAICE